MTDLHDLADEVRDLATPDLPYELRAHILEAAIALSNLAHHYDIHRTAQPC